MLNCKLNPGIGFVIAGHQSMEYSFTPNTPDQPQRYDSAIDTVGLDVGFTTDGALGWPSLHPLSVRLSDRWPANMSGSPETGIGVGGGANVLIRGLGRSFALQPVPLEGSAGLERRARDLSAQTASSR
jgi:hypothetical protein